MFRSVTECCNLNYGSIPKFGQEILAGSDSRLRGVVSHCVFNLLPGENINLPH